jgi:hypothetical protein
VEYCNNHRLSGCLKYRSPEDTEGSRLCVWTGRSCMSNGCISDSTQGGLKGNNLQSHGP